MNPPEPHPGAASSPDAALTDSAELQAFFSQLHERFTTRADVAIGAQLAEFIEVIHLPNASNPAASPTTTPTRSRKMLTGISAFVATTTGKIVLGTTVAAASVGGMHAAEVVDVPLLPDQAKAEVLMVDEAEEVEADGVAADEVPEAEAAVPVVDAAEEAGEDVGEDADDEAAEEEEPKNHGAVVSEFARTTDLDGCEKGQAISELARSKEKKNKHADGDDADGEDVDGDDVDLDDEPIHTEEDAEDDEAVEESKCNSDDDDEADDADEDDADDDDDDDEDGDGPPEGKGYNRDDHPGKGPKADTSDD